MARITGRRKTRIIKNALGLPLPFMLLSGAASTAAAGGGGEEALRGEALRGEALRGEALGGEGLSLLPERGRGEEVWEGGVLFCGLLAPLLPPLDWVGEEGAVVP